MADGWSVTVDPAWSLEWAEWEFDYFRRACAADGDSLKTTLGYVVRWWRRIAEVEGVILRAAQPVRRRPWIPLRGPMFVPDPRGGPGCTIDMG